MGDENQFKEYRDLYETADGLSKEVAEFRAEVVIPAHNQLRYAGHRLALAVGAGGIVDPDQFHKAIAHCERAMYEAAEAGITSALDRVIQFREDYKDIEVGDIVPEYRQVIALARSSAELVAQPRSEDSPSANAQRYMGKFRELRDGLEALENGRDDLNARVAQQAKESRRFIIRTLLLSLGTAVARLSAAGIWLA